MYCYWKIICMYHCKYLQYAIYNHLAYKYLHLQHFQHLPWLQHLHEQPHLPWFTIYLPTTGDGRNPAPVDVVNILVFTGFHSSQVVQDFFHQEYVSFKGCRRTTRPLVDLDLLLVNMVKCSNQRHTVDGRNPANQLIGGLSHYLQGFIHVRWLFGISSTKEISSSSKWWCKLQQSRLIVQHHLKLWTHPSHLVIKMGWSWNPKQPV